MFCVPEHKKLQRKAKHSIKQSMDYAECQLLNDREGEYVEKLIELRSVTAVRMWCFEKYGIPAPSANSLRSWLE